MWYTIAYQTPIYLQTKDLHHIITSCKLSLAALELFQHVVPALLLKHQRRQVGWRTLCLFVLFAKFPQSLVHVILVDHYAAL